MSFTFLQILIVLAFMGVAAVLGFIYGYDRAEAKGYKCGFDDGAYQATQQRWKAEFAPSKSKGDA